MIAVQSSVSVAMLRLCLIGVLFAILFADGVDSSDPRRNLTVNEGSVFAIFVETEADHSVKTCLLNSPQNKQFEFTPYNVSASNEKYQIYENSPFACMVSVRNIDINDEGVWILTEDHELQDGARSASVDLTVVVTEPEYNEDENMTFLSMIDHFTRIGLSIDISLDKRSFEEECYVQPPNGVLTKAENFNMENVIVQSSSNFVSCRITLGPMSASLLGMWSLCGKSTQTDEMRCQPANIVWNNNNSPNAEWGSLTQNMFSHPVHFGGSVNPGVASTADVVTCNVITPNGEDLVITRDVNYPHIERIAFDRRHLCSINFTNIDRTSIGEWTVYGKFRSVFAGLHEIHLPLKFFLYNEERPYDQAYNVTTLQEDSYLVILGRTLEVSVTSVIGQVEDCQYRMPTGQSYDLNDAIAPNGIVLKGVDAPACRITLSPITKDMLGEWQLIGKFSNGNQFTERRQTFYIIQEDPSNPILDDFRSVEYLTETILYTKLGTSHRVTITTENRVENESCHLMTPNGFQYAFIDGFHIPNVEILEENGIECGIKVDVLDLDMLGEWILIARATRSSNRIERRRHFSIRIEDGVDNSDSRRNLTINEGNYFGIFVETEVNHSAKTCLLKSPQNKILEFTPHNVSASNEKYQIHEDGSFDCMVSVHNIDINDEGVWLLTEDHELQDRARSASVNLTVIVTEPENNEVEDKSVLSIINHFTRIGLSIDISLDKRSFEEECYVRPPNGVLTKAENFNMENVIVQSSSNFVSCRITLGPMSASLLGMWSLCGKSTQTDEMRCQPANIVWNNNNNPNADWGSLTQNMFSHPVHFGGSVNPGVASTADVVTCNVITPNGEDLVITRDVNYPHIERIAFDRQHLCSINFTNIDRTSIGEWTVYGKFRSVFTGLHEIHLPLKFFLYNEERPYDQAYNVTALQEDSYLVILGRTLEVSVTSVIGQVEDCQYRMPTGQSYDLNDATAPNGIVLKGVDAPACRITLSPITKDMLGEWQLIGKFSNGNQFTERRQTFYIIQEDPARPILDDFRVVENLTETILDTKLGASHRVTITTANRVENESCHLMTPNGLQYAFIDGFHIPNVEILEENGIECGIKVDILDLDMIGDWILIARATRSSTPIERRRHFTIRIEETSSLGDAITITEGADLYLSLPNATNMYQTCRLYANNEEVTDFEVDLFRYSSCGYIVRNVTRAQHGTWAIVYENQIIYRATVEVNILELVEISVENMVWPVGSSVNVTIGPEDAVYCRLIDFNGNYVYDGFGPCRAVVDRVTEAHQGLWTISVGVSGTVMLRQNWFYVDVIATDSKPVVTTDVVRNGSSVIMTCSVPGENEIHACLFRDPSGNNVLIASHGVGQDGVSGAVIRYESDTDSQICSLRLLTPSSEHQGIWRCAVNTARDISYGFLTVSGSIFYQGSSYYDTEPELKSADIFRGKEGNAVTMSCSIEAAVRYCYFRAPNGTVFNVAPSISSTDYEYVGNGFDAGECGIRFHNLLRNDSGSWSCNVGMVHNHEELSRAFEVSVYEPMWMYHGWQGNSVSLRLQIGGAPKLEYCRFVRIDGLGFTSDNVPFAYDFDADELALGVCYLKIPSPMSQDLDPWTVFAKTIASEGELSMTSTFVLPPPLFSDTSLIIPILMWTLFALVCLLIVLAAVSLIPKKNREWTYQRASVIRNSFKKQQPRPVQTDMLY